MRKSTSNLWMIALCILVFGLQSCLDDEEEGRKITDQKEYELTVASETVPGVLTNGMDPLSEVYAVKKDNASEWTPFGDSLDFEYEEGYEYRIRINETSYLDPQMGDPAWTEYKLLEVLSKEKKASENLPNHFIPKWFYEKNQYVPEYRFAVDAEQKELIEKDLKENPPMLATCHVMLYHRVEKWKWLAIDSKDAVMGQGILKAEHASDEDFQDSYKLLPLEHIHGKMMRWTFVDYSENGLDLEPYDVFFAVGQLTKSVGQTPDPWLYQDLTDYYKHKFPEAGVKTVVYSLGLRVNL